MENIKTIRNVDEETWVKLKTLAVHYRISIGALLRKMVEEYRKKTEDNWNKILFSGKIISDKEAEELTEFVKENRKEVDFR